MFIVFPLIFKRFINDKGERLQLKTPYREHLSQSFTRPLMRVVYLQNTSSNIENTMLIERTLNDWFKGIEWTIFICPMKIESYLIR
ncbi:hypothetical protein DRO66_04175 [Candidatus Bathyarchaeota archaeon]|nr:MAG: hypothetical protein DRO66_04175 [Candidatus Bathyarchaeota archaeon]